MLLNPNLYAASQTPDREHFPFDNPNQYRFLPVKGWRAVEKNVKQPAEMLLIHQAGSVRVGEVVRFVLAASHRQLIVG